MLAKKILALSFMVITTIATAQERFIPLFSDSVPEAKLNIVEKSVSSGNTGGRTVNRISNVTAPGITVYQASKENATGAAVLVCPGGGYNILAYDLEGTEVCEWLNSLGITAILLKYRVPRRAGRAKHEAPLEDAQRAMQYIRQNSETLQIDSNKVGVIGFSAGAHLSAMLSNAAPSADKIDLRPNFCMLIYPAYLDGARFELASEVTPSAQTPPTLLIQAQDDKPYINSSLFYYYALKELQVPTTMHLYPAGGHGYGLRDGGFSVSQWPLRAAAWLQSLEATNKH